MFECIVILILIMGFGEISSKLDKNNKNNEEERVENFDKESK